MSGFRKRVDRSFLYPGNLPHARALCNIGNENVLRFGYVWDVVSGGGGGGGHFDYLTRPASNAKFVRVYPLCIWI